MKKIYVAAPIVNASEKMRNQIHEVIDTLRKYNFDVHDPSLTKIPNADGMTCDEWARCVFTLDVLAINECDWVVVCDFGRHGTAGTAWETGYAFGTKKNILIIHMDDINDFSVMMRGSSSNYCFLNDFLNSDNINDFFIYRKELACKAQLN